MVYKNNPQLISTETISEWAFRLKSANNPMNIDAALLEKNYKLSPPVEYEGGTYLGRYIVPLSYIVASGDVQPRDKKFDPNHQRALADKFSIAGYLADQPPMMATPLDGSKFSVDLAAGFHRKGACGDIMQECYIVDLYKFDNKLDELVARTETNHHAAPSLSQTIEDYAKEIVSAYHAGLISRSEEEITKLANRMARGDKTKSQIGKIADRAIKNIGGVYSNFRTYSTSKSKKDGKFNENSLHFWMSEQRYAPQGIEHRTDEELIKQGYIAYCTAEGDNKASWSRAMYHGQRLGIPVWLFAYASTRQDDLALWRKEWIEDFIHMKSVMVDWAADVTSSDLSDGIDEDKFCVKFAGFLPQHTRKQEDNKGRPTETTLVDLNGKKLSFDLNGVCYTQKMNIDVTSVKVGDFVFVETESTS